MYFIEGIFKKKRKKKKKKRKKILSFVKKYMGNLTTPNNILSRYVSFRKGRSLSERCYYNKIFIF
jgi:hypothetical protein